MKGWSSPWKVILPNWALAAEPILFHWLGSGFPWASTYLLALTNSQGVPAWLNRRGGGTHICPLSKRINLQLVILTVQSPDVQYILVLHVNLRNYLLVDEVEGADSSTSSSDIGQVNLIVLFILNDSSLSQQLYRKAWSRRATITRRPARRTGRRSSIFRATFISSFNLTNILALTTSFLVVLLQLVAITFLVTIFMPIVTVVLQSLPRTNPPWAAVERRCWICFGEHLTKALS